MQLETISLPIQPQMDVHLDPSSCYLVFGLQAAARGFQHMSAGLYMDMDRNNMQQVGCSSAVKFCSRLQ